MKTNPTPVFPPYMDNPLNHDVSCPTQGPMVLYLKTLFLGTEFWNVGLYFPNYEYCPGIATAIQRLQKKYDLEEDGSFGPDTRRAFQKEFGIDVDQILYMDVFGELVPNFAIQATGEVLKWPPQNTKE